MKTKHHWKSGNTLDNVLNVLLLVVALGLLGAGAMEIAVDASHLVSVAAQLA